MPTNELKRSICVAQVLPALNEGGVERGTVEVATALAAQGHRALVISAGGRLVPTLTQIGAEHIRMPIGVKSPWTLRLVPRLRRLLQEQRVDVVHPRSRLPAWITYLAWRRMSQETRPRFVTTVHGFYSVNRYSAVMTRGERIIAVSDSIRHYIRHNYPSVSDERILVIHRGVDRAVFPFGFEPPQEWQSRWRADLPQLKDRIVLTLPARLTRWKGQLDFIEIIDRLVRSDLPVHGLIVGGHDPRRSPYVRELKEKIHGAGMGQHMTLLGYRKDLREIMSVSNFVLSLSRDPEAFGRTTIEALSLGRPVCGYDHGGVGEQLRAIFPDGAVPVGDIDMAAQKIRRWFQSPPKVPREHPFTLETMLTNTLTLYSSLVLERF